MMCCVSSAFTKLRAKPPNSLVDLVQIDFIMMS